MVNVSTTITVKFDYRPDQSCTRLAADVSGATAELLTLLRTQLGARTSNDGQTFDVEVQYALTAQNHIKAAGGDVEFRPASLKVPLANIVDEVLGASTERANWPVMAVEVLSESVDFTIADEFYSVVFHVTCTARVTQAKPDLGSAPSGAPA